MNPITRRALWSSIPALAIPAIASATYTKPKKCECDCKDGKEGPKGDTGPAGPKGDKGDKGDPGVCNCQPKELKSIHVDFELTIKGLAIPQPSVIINTPGVGALNDELWYFPQWNACVFFDYNHPSGIPHYITFYRMGEFATWDRVTPMGVRVWNWHKQNPETGRNHSCVVSLDKILANRNKIIQDWTPLTSAITYGSF